MRRSSRSRRLFCSDTATRVAVAAAVVADVVIGPIVFVDGGGKPGRNELELGFANVDDDIKHPALSSYPFAAIYRSHAEAGASVRL